MPYPSKDLTFSSKHSDSSDISIKRLKKEISHAPKTKNFLIQRQNLFEFKKKKDTLQLRLHKLQMNQQLSPQKKKRMELQNMQRKLDDEEIEKEFWAKLLAEDLCEDLLDENSEWYQKNMQKIELIKVRQKTTKFELDRQTAKLLNIQGFNKHVASDI